MRFMILRKADAKTEANVMPNKDLLAAMGKYMADAAQAGIMLAGEGLQASARGARVKFSAGKPTVTEGPFGEPRELLAGFCMIQVKSRQEAIDWVKHWPTLDGDGNVEIEIRQLFEAEDFGAEFTPELQTAETCARLQTAKNAQTK